MNAPWLRFAPNILRQRLHDRNDLQSIIGNSGWLLLDRVVRSGVGLTVGVWVARYLGPGQFGQLNVAIAFVALFGAIASLGLDGIVVRDLVRHPENTTETLNAAFALKLLGSTSAVVISIAAIFIFRPHDTSAHWTVAIIAIGMIFQSIDVIDFWFQSQVQSKFTVYARNAAFLSASLLKVGVVLCAGSLFALAWTTTIELALASLALLLTFNQQNRQLTLKAANIHRMAALLRESWPLLLSGLAIMLYMRIDQVMLSQMVGDHEVGLYSAALRFSEIWFVIPMTLVNSVSPSLTELRKTSPSAYLIRLQKLLNLLTRLTVIVAIVMTAIASPLVSRLLGPQYEAAGSILAIHIWTLVFVSLGVTSSQWFLNEGLTKTSLNRTVLGAIVNVVLNCFLIKPFGAQGCAMATIVAQAVSALLSNCFFEKTRPLFRMQVRALFFV